MATPDTQKPDKGTWTKKTLEFRAIEDLGSRGSNPPRSDPPEAFLSRQEATEEISEGLVINVSVRPDLDDEDYNRIFENVREVVKRDADRMRESHGITVHIRPMDTRSSTQKGATSGNVQIYISDSFQPKNWETGEPLYGSERDSRAFESFTNGARLTNQAIKDALQNDWPLWVEAKRERDLAYKRTAQKNAAFAAGEHEQKTEKPAGRQI